MFDPENVEEEQEPTEETDPDPSEEEDVEPAHEAAEPSPPKPTDELKVVIIMKADNLMLGIQSPDCDPVYRTMKGSLAAALKKVPALVTEAKQQWEVNPRYPKADLPEPAPRPTPARTPPPKPKVQPSFF